MHYLNGLTLGRYFGGDSIIHRLDPRSKLICALLLMVAVFTIGSIIGIVLFMFLSMALFLLADIPLRLFWNNLRMFFLLYAITFAIHLFFHPGNAIIQLPLLGWEITLEGIRAGILFTVRIAVLISISTLLMSVTTPQDLTDGLEKLFRPLTGLRVPVSEGALMISIALRFVPILMQEAVKIQQAQVSRGADMEGSWIVRIRKSLPMILPLFAGALKKADDLALALEARGYRGGKGRTKLIELRIQQRDVTALFLTCAIFLSFLLLG